MKVMKKAIAIVLSAAMITGASVSAFAANSEKEGYNFFEHAVDNVFGAVQDGIFAALTALNLRFGVQSAKSYKAGESEFFYPGTNGKVSGSGWKAGFADNSVIPEKWRRDAQGNPDPEGYCLDKKHCGGGYQAEIDKIYSGQNVNVLVLSNNCDINSNGKNDIIIMISVDGVGITSVTCRDIRKGVEEKLSRYGITSGDILSCTVSATHCHAGLDIQGMYWKRILSVLFLNLFKRFIPDQYMLTLEKDMHDTLVEKSSDAVQRAFEGMENGTLSFFNTDEAEGVRDKFKSGAKTQNRFSSFIFESDSGKKTIVSNIGAHPVSANAQQTHMTDCDYPYYMKLAMKDAGYDFMFIQGTQAGVSTADAEIGRDAEEWAASKALTREQWVERYGEEVTAEMYEGCEPGFGDMYKKGYALAHFVLDAVNRKKAVAPTVNIKATEILLDCDFGLMEVGAATGVLGFNAVRSITAESGYGIMVEIGYIELGEDVAFITVPGELSPACVYGTKEGYDGLTKWTGPQSWSGKDWQYRTLEDMVRESSGDSNKQVLVMGLTNDAIGYNLPDTVATKGILTPLLIYNGEGGNEVANSMLMTVSDESASDIVKGFGTLLEVNAEK
ncbi:MAG: hypothetical protein IJM02_01830 [Clostridia bacterium]|nr:hypothetical protein [Clostridia bacterium]